MRTTNLLLICLILVVGLIGCDSDGNPLPIPTEPTPTPTVWPTPAPECPNPIANGPEIFGVSDNLYKFESDSDGNVVVLLNSIYQHQFDWCRIRTGSNEWRNLRCIDNAPWTQIPFSCFSNPVGSNPPRQTWRADIPCGEVHKVEVACGDACQGVTFVAPQGQQGETCERFG